MAESISRTEWLRLEIDAAEDYVARHATDPDPIAHAQALRRQREVAALRAELAVRDAAAADNLIGAYVRIRHRGPHGITVIESFVTDLDDDGEGVEVSSHASHSFPLEEVTLLEDDGPIVHITRGPELQYGTSWTDPTQPDDRWTASWHPATGDLTARNQRSGALRLLATILTRDDVDQALAGWAELAHRPDGLAQLTARLRRPRPGSGLESAAAYGVVVDSDGAVTRIAQPARHAIIRLVLGEVDDLAVLTLPGGGHVMFVDDHARGRPFNAAATSLYGTGWPILGAVVVAHDDPNRPLDDGDVRLIELLADAHAQGAAPARDTGTSNVHGLVVRADGRRITLHAAITADVVRDVLHGRSTYVEAAAWPHVPDDLRMVVTEQLAELPANDYATRIHAGRRRVRGDVIVCRRSGGPLPAHLVRHLCGDLNQASRTLKLRSAAELRSHLAGARQLQASHRSRPELAGDPLADQMRHDNERDIVRLVAELDRRVSPLPHPAPSPPSPKLHDCVSAPPHPTPSPPSAGLTP